MKTVFTKNVCFCLVDESVRKQRTRRLHSGCYLLAAEWLVIAPEAGRRQEEPGVPQGHRLRPVPLPAGSNSHHRVLTPHPTRYGQGSAFLSLVFIGALMRGPPIKPITPRLIQRH